LSNFRDVQHRPLRIYNRCVVASNIMEDAGKAPAEDYLAQFTTTEQLEMRQMYELIQLKGTKAVKALITEGVEFSDDEYVGKER
jgi:hypothetical protein